MCLLSSTIDTNTKNQPNNNYGLTPISHHYHLQSPTRRRSTPPPQQQEEIYNDDNTIHPNNMTYDTQEKIYKDKINELSLQALGEIKTKIKQQNVLKPTKWSGFVAVLDSVGWYVLVAYLFATNTNFWLLGIAWGWAIARCGFVMHMAIHQGIFQNPKHNNFMGILVQNFLIGISWRWWRERHNRHHQHCNVLDADPDLKTNPFLVYSEAIETGQLTQYQALLLPVYCSIHIWVWRIFSIKRCIKKGWWSDLVATTCHWIVLLTIFVYFSQEYTWLECIAIQIIATAVGGIYLDTVFMMNHFLELVLAPKDHDGYHLLLQILITTRNIGVVNNNSTTATSNDISSNIMNYYYYFEEMLLLILTGGLNYQIEHHLFPQCPIEKLPELSRIVRDACESHGLPYKVSSAHGTLWEIWERLNHIAKIASNKTNESPSSTYTTKDD